MTIARTVRTAALIAVGSIAIAALGHEFFYLHWLRSVVARGGARLLESEAGTLEREIRSIVPPGSLSRVPPSPSRLVAQIGVE
jgi:hypothetical protein